MSLGRRIQESEKGVSLSKSCGLSVSGVAAAAALLLSEVSVWEDDACRILLYISGFSAPYTTSRE